MKLLSLLATILLCVCLASPLAAADEAKARGLLNALGCKGCHSFEGSGGTLGPALDGVGKRLTRSQLQSKLLEPKIANPASKMPAYGHLAKADLEALLEFLELRK